MLVFLSFVKASAATPVPPSRCGCRSSRKGARAAILRRIPSALAEIERNPEQPEPPRIAAARTAARKHEGVRGKRHFTLTFTCHFRLRRTPHWGVVARECPRRLCARGSMTLRRAKAASPLQISSALKKPQIHQSTNKVTSSPPAAGSAETPASRDATGCTPCPAAGR